MRGERTAATMQREKSAREAAQRTAFLVWVADFTEFITRERGKFLKGTNGSSRTSAARELQNFNDFSFLLDRGQSMMGGNTLKLWHHPGGLYNEKKSPLVLHIWWQFGVEQCDVLVFSPNEEWRNKLVEVMRHVEGAPVKIGSDRLSAKERRLRDEEERERQLDIQSRKGRTHFL